MNSNYWNERREMLYYRYVFQMACVVAGDAESMIDVGSKNCGYMEWFYWVGSKTSLDLTKPYTGPGIKSVRSDFLSWEPDDSYDLVLCLQVLEHVPNAHVEAFARKLLNLGKHLIVSVPYKWPKGESEHVHDPVTLGKLTSWIGRKPNEFHVVDEVFGRPEFNRRLIAYYNRDDPGKRISSLDLSVRRVSPPDGTTFSLSSDHPAENGTDHRERIRSRTLETLKEQNDLLKRNLQMAHLRCSEYETLYSQISGSKFWRATSPLRKALDIVKGLLRKPRRTLS